MNWTRAFSTCILTLAFSAAAAHAQTATTTTLALTSVGTPETSAASGTTVTLTATVTAGAAPVTPGQVNFCDASAAYCTDIHLLGTAELTSAGTATFKFRPGVGSHSYKAVFLGTHIYSASTSATAALSVTGPPPTATTLAYSGSAGNYTLTATVGGIASTAPTGTVSFLDATESNSVLTTAPLGAGAEGLNFLNYSNPAIEQQYPTYDFPESFAVGDFNGDGIPDIAVPNLENNDLTILLGDGTGNFAPTATSPLVGPEPVSPSAPYFYGNYPTSVAAGDFNGDGVLDLAVTDSKNARVSILLGNGDGSFTPAPKSPAATAANPSFVAVGDFNGDGILDLAVANNGDGVVTILLGNGDGTFAQAPAIPLGLYSYLTDVAVGDFNGDGVLDLAAVGGGGVSILLGRGDGTFTQTPGSPIVASFPNPDGDNFSPIPLFSFAVTVADFNGDGVLDLAVANLTYSCDEIEPCGAPVTILVGSGNGAFTVSPETYYSGTYTDSIVAGDFNGDGIPDLATASGYGGGVAVLVGNGNGTFYEAANPQFYATVLSIPMSVAVGDFNGDGRSDLAVASLYGYDIYETTPLNGHVNILLAENQTATATASGVALPAATDLVEASYPGDSGNAASTSVATSLTATASQVTPYLTWAHPAPITYGTPLSVAQLNASASFPQVYPSTVPGTFTYSPAAGTVLKAGIQTLLVTFTPTDTAYVYDYYPNVNYYYTTAMAEVQLVVNKATPTISWSAPPPIPYGTALSASQLNATSTVPGTFYYNPLPGTVLPLGSYTLGVTLMPTDTADYLSAKAFVPLTVSQGTKPELTWAMPASINYGTALSAAQLNATSSVPGSFTYSPALGTVLTAGIQKLSATFTPTSSAYATATTSVLLVVNKATPSITWAAPASIPYGTALGASQLNATSIVPGAFYYNPLPGTVLPLGSYTLGVTLMPADTADYLSAKAFVPLTVNQGSTPQLTWAMPASINYGTALSAAQLNATSSVPGTFTYSPAPGTVLTAGIQKLSVTFTPTNSAYTTATTSVNLIVNKATPTVTWATPAPISSGTPLSSSQLDATSTVPGTFYYNLPAGYILPPGSHTLSVTFMPTDLADYLSATATVTLTVN